MNFAHSPNLLSRFLLGLMVCLPFLQPIHHKPLPAFYEEVLAFSLGMLALLAWLGSKPQKIHFPSILWLPAVLLLATLLQLITGQINIPMLALFQAAYLFWAITLICLANSLKTHENDFSLVHVIASALVAGGLASALTAYAQRLGLDLDWRLVMPSFGRVYGNQGQPNLLATQLWLGLCSLIYFQQIGRLRLRFALPGLFFIASACGLTASRMAWLHGVVLLGLVAFMLWQNQRKLAPPQKAVQHATQTTPHAIQPDAFWLLLFCLFSVIAAGEISSYLPWMHGKEPITALDRLRAGLVSGDARFDIWRDTLSVIRQQPWLGGGIGNYSWNNAMAAALAPAGASTFAGAEHAHNLFLQMAADYGLPLTLLMSLFVLFWLRKQLQAPLNAERLLLLACLTLIFIHSQLEYPLWHADYLGLTALLLGLLGAPGRAIQGLRLRLLSLACLAGLLGAGLLYRDYRTLDEALVIYRAQTQTETAWKEGWQRRMNIIADLSTHSMLAPYARGALAALTTPDPEEARHQTLICESAMHLWASAGMMTQCAVLRHMLGQTAAAEELHSTVKKAFRTPADQKLIAAIWAMRLPATESKDKADTDAEKE